MKPTVLAGRRVLLVEDELLIAMLVESALGDAGCTVVGPYASVGAAKTAARGESLDLAVLDINLAGEMVFPVADLLERRGVPFLLLSGYGNDALPPGHRDWPICGKPFRTGALLAMLAALIQPRPPSDGREAGG